MFKYMYNLRGGLIISALNFKDVSWDDYAIINSAYTIIPKSTLDKLFPCNINRYHDSMFIIPDRIVMPNINKYRTYLEILSYPVKSHRENGAVCLDQYARLSIQTDINVYCNTKIGKA
jgi:hypothetical protein